MIPISAAPKRFVASLVSYVNTSKSLIKTSSFQIQSIRLHSTEGLKFNLTSKFSTKLDPKYEIDLHHYDNHLHHFTGCQVKVPDITVSNVKNDLWYTGKKPIVYECPGVCEDGKIYSLPQLNLDNCTKQAIQDYFDNTWTLTEVLFASLQGEEAFLVSPLHKLRHPMIFYYGHVATLYINKLRVAGLLKDSINPYFESIFETGVDEMSWDDLSKNEMKWPSVQEVHEYRKKAYNVVSELIANLTDEECQNITIDKPLWSLVMGFEHERIHLETSSMLITELPLHYVKSPEAFPSYYQPPISFNKASGSEPIQGKDYPANEFIEVNSTVVNLGKPVDFPSFGWDNEYGSRAYNVSQFSATKFLISNGEFSEFVKDSGYARPELWTEVGWNWRAFRNTKWPTFWVREGPQGLHHYDMRLMFDVVPMMWNLPVVINLHEAVAFSNWKSLMTGKKLRLMTELEHHAIRDPLIKENEKYYVNDPILSFTAAKNVNDRSISVSKQSRNVNLCYSSMTPVDYYPPNQKGFYDVMGNAWERCIDYFASLPGFKAHPYYEDFSTPCFDGRHNVIMGGSFVSTGNEASNFSRFHFRPHFHQFSSFRLVESEVEDKFVLTSDTDASAPFVGNYPFRKSSNKDAVFENTSTVIDDVVSVYSVAQSTAHIHRQAKSLLEHNLALSIDVLPIVKSYSKANLDDNSSLSDSAILLIHLNKKDINEVSKYVQLTGFKYVNSFRNAN